MCSDNGSDHTCFHILWSGGGTRRNVLRGVVALHTEVETILSERNHPLALRFSNSRCMLKLAYLSDISAENKRGEYFNARP